MDLSTRIGSLTLDNPIVAASGCFGYGVEYADLVDLSSLGGIAVKGLFLTEREGHPPPRVIETPAGMLNAIGLQGIGVHRFIAERLPELRQRRATVIVNICGTTLDEYVEVARILSDAEGVAALDQDRLELLFKRTDLLADSGLGHHVDLSRFGKTLRFSQVTKHFQTFDLHRETSKQKQSSSQLFFWQATPFVFPRSWTRSRASRRRLSGPDRKRQFYLCSHPRPAQ